MMNRRMKRKISSNHSGNKRRWLIGVVSITVLIVAVLVIMFFSNDLLLSKHIGDKAAEDMAYSANREGMDKELGDKSGALQEDAGNLNATHHPDENNAKETTNHEKANDSNERDENVEVEEIRVVSDELVLVLAENDGERVATYVHPDKGVLFSPYVFITDNAVVIHQEDMATLLNEKEPYM